MASENPPGPPTRHPRGGRSLLVRAPSTPVSLFLAALVGALLTLVFPLPRGATDFAAIYLGAFLIPAVAATAVTPPLAAVLGGRFAMRRSAFLVLSGVVVTVPLIGIGAGFDRLVPGMSIPVVLFFLLAQGPVLWFRHLSLFGVSNPSHARTLPVSLLHPALSALGVAVAVGLDPAESVAAVVFLVFGFLTSVLLLRAADRPMRREFQTSGVGLIRPMLDHINDRDPDGTDQMESFFARFAIPANLSVSVLEFRARGKAKATVVVPTVHPGPFAALGASDLPRKVAEHLGPASGLVLVPHSPCNHELDLPDRAAVERVLVAIAELRDHGLGEPVARSGPLVAGGPDSLARAQCLGAATLAVVTQAPAPTDDIAFAVGELVRVRDAANRSGPLLLVDGHNSYVEDRGDVAFGSTVAARLERDVADAVAAARAAVGPTSPEVGVASRSDFSIRSDGIGPAGIRVLAVRAGRRTSAYVLIDGNNLVVGFRAQILAALQGIVDDAEVMTTDNHIVHEVDGGTNPVGERMSAPALAAACRALVELAVGDLEPSEVRSGVASVPSVPVLGPSWTERLLTSLGDTVSVFGHQAASTLLLLLVASTVVLVVLR